MYKKSDCKLNLCNRFFTEEFCFLCLYLIETFTVNTSNNTL